MMAPATVFNVSSSSKVLKFIQTHIDCMKCPQPKNTAVRRQDHIHDEPPKHSTSAFQHYWTVHPFSPRNGPIDHTAGNLLCIPYCLTQEESSSPEWYFSCMCKTPKRQSGFLHHRKKLSMNPSTSPVGTSPFPSLSRGQGCYRLTGLCLPKRLLTLGGRSGQTD